MHHDEHFEQSIIIGFFPAEEHILDQMMKLTLPYPQLLWLTWILYPH